MTDSRLTVPTNPARALRDLNRRPAVSPPDHDEAEAELQNNTTILQSDKPTNKQPDNLTNNKTNLLTDQQTINPTDKPTSRQTNQQADRQLGQNKVTLTDAPQKRGLETEKAPEVERPRMDGRTSRPRQETADRTMVTSMRLAVSTLEALDEHCYRHRQRKQDVVQAALDLYFAAENAAENEAS